MKVLAFIVEYNPFHYGHKYHLEESLSITKATHSIALMSSSFVQRGEPALIDKWTRAKMAVKNGVDLVLELPFVYSCQSAELFAKGAINILNSLNTVDFLSFGSELGSLKPLSIISNILSKEPVSYRVSLKNYLSKGYSFPISRSKALIEELERNKLILDYPFEEIIRGSNNILAIEYLKSLLKSKSTISPVTIKRLGADYKDIITNNNIASATGIRSSLFSKGISYIEDLVPFETSNLLKEFYRKYNTFNSLNNYESIIRYLLLTKDKDHIKMIFDVEEGLENRIFRKALVGNDINNIIGLISSKRHPNTRIQRILIHLLNELDGNMVRKLYSTEPKYTRVLAANKKGIEILGQIKSNSDINIISKYANYKSLNKTVINDFLNFEEKATNIYYWGLNNTPLEVNSDYYTSPYIEN